MSVKNRTLVTLSLAGINTGVWETLVGRELDSLGDTYRPGPGAAQHALGGPHTYSEITVTRTWLEARDGPLYRQLNAKKSTAAGSCAEQPLDQDFNAFDTPTVWPVRLKGLKRPEVDVESGDRKMFEVAMWVDGDPS